MIDEWRNIGKRNRFCRIGFGHVEFEMLWYIYEMTCTEHKGAYGSNSRDNFGLECKRGKNHNIPGVSAMCIDINMTQENRIDWEIIERGNFKNE